MKLHVSLQISHGTLLFSYVLSLRAFFATRYVGNGCGTDTNGDDDGRQPTANKRMCVYEEMIIRCVLCARLWRCCLLGTSCQEANETFWNEGRTRWRQFGWPQGKHNNTIMLQNIGDYTFQWEPTAHTWICSILCSASGMLFAGVCECVTRRILSPLMRYALHLINEWWMVMSFAHFIQRDMGDNVLKEKICNDKRSWRWMWPQHNQ